MYMGEGLAVHAGDVTREVQDFQIILEYFVFVLFGFEIIVAELDFAQGADALE